MFETFHIPCATCGCSISYDDLVWIDEEGDASTGENALPYHVGCATDQYPNDSDKDSKE